MDLEPSRQLDAALGHRAGISEFLTHVIADIYSRFDGGADAFDRVCQSCITTMHGIDWSRFDVSDPDYAKQHALQSVEVFQRAANEIRKLRGEPTSRPA